MGRQKLYGDDSMVYTFRGPKLIDQAIKNIAKRRETNHTRLTYELLMEHPLVVAEIERLKKQQKHEHPRKSKTNPLRKS